MHNYQSKVPNLIYYFNLRIVDFFGDFQIKFLQLADHLKINEVAYVIRNDSKL